MITQFGFILLFFIAAIFLIFVILGIAKLLRPDNPGIEKNAIYESGEQTIGSMNVAFNLRFYILALVFILFDVELVVLFPWAVVFGNADLINSTHGTWAYFAGIEMFVFVLFLVVGLIYVWKNKYLDWMTDFETSKPTKGMVPKELYEKVNEKYS